MKVLTEIWIYPVKSLGGIRVTSARVLSKGLAFDRRMMLTDSEGRFLTQREHPILSQFRLAWSGDQFSISFRNSSLLIPSNGWTEGQSRDVVVWDDTVSAIVAPNTINEWFSGHLGFQTQLVFFPEDNHRPASDPPGPVSLADGFPILIVGESSLADLNSRLVTPVPMNRFRPNLVFSGGSAYEEDTWKTFSIGMNRFTGVRPCSRCVMTTVDQSTGMAGQEPLRTLSGYRKKNGKVYFGENVVPLDFNEIRENDIIVPD